MIAVADFRKNEKNSILPETQSIFEYAVNAITDQATVSEDGNFSEWKSLLFNSAYVAGQLTAPLAFKVNKTEQMKDLEPDLEAIQKSQANPYHALQAGLPEDLQRNRQLPSLLIRTVYETLFIVRPCS
jgi:hypothetical protein